jgi:hypothetical protein
MVLIQCSVSDMPSTGYVSIFCRLSVFLNFSLLSLEIWVKKSNFAAHTNLLGLFWFINDKVTNDSIENIISHANL